MLAHTRQFACLHRLLCPQKVMDVPSLSRQYLGCKGLAAMLYRSVHAMLLSALRCSYSMGLLQGGGEVESTNI
jgi:hypothetical protein